MNVPDHPAWEIPLPKLPAATSLCPVDELRGEALSLKKLRVVETGGNAYRRERTQWDSGAILSAHLRKAFEVIIIAGAELGAGVAAVIA
jgi:arginine deiminase